MALKELRITITKTVVTEHIVNEDEGYSIPKGTEALIDFVASVKNELLSECAENSESQVYRKVTLVEFEDE